MLARSGDTCSKRNAGLIAPGSALNNPTRLRALLKSTSAAAGRSAVAAGGPIRQAQSVAHDGRYVRKQFNVPYWCWAFSATDEVLQLLKDSPARGAVVDGAYNVATTKDVQLVTGSFYSSLLQRYTQPFRCVIGTLILVQRVFGWRGVNVLRLWLVAALVVRVRPRLQLRCLGKGGAVAALLTGIFRV